MARRRSKTRPSVVLLALLALVCFGAPWLSPQDPNEQPDPVGGRLKPPGTVLHEVALARGGVVLADRVERTTDGLRLLRNGKEEHLRADQVLNLTAQGVSGKRTFWLGSDAFSRDVLSRWLHGGRLSLTISVVSMLMCLVLGVGIGSVSALGAGWLDAVLMRLVEALQTIPWFVLLVALRAILPPGPGTLVLILGATGWPTIARQMRAEVLTLKDRDFVHASRGLGVPEILVFWRHVLPNALTPILVSATLIVGYLIVAESALSFLGLGVETPQASWGNMIDEGRHHLSRAWWLFSLPTAGLVTTVICLNLAADHLRDALDPRRTEPT